MEKLHTLEDAIARYVDDGDSLVMGACLEPMIPFAAAHELIRQGKQDLTLIAPISDILFDIMIGTGQVKRIISAWAGNVSAGLGHNYRRSIEKGTPRRVEIEDHSNFSLGLSLLAGAMGIPYLPTKTLLGTSLLKSNPSFTVHENNGEKLVHIPALKPDVAIIGVQRSDANGNAHLWGNLGVAQDAALASQKVILLTEEIVDKRQIESDPNRVFVPGYKIEAVVHCPGFSYPSPMQGYYRRDHEFFHDYHVNTKTAEGFEEWLNQWVYSVSTHEDFLRLVGEEKVTGLKVKKKQYAEAVNYAAE